MRIWVRGDVEAPKRATDGSAGYDIFAPHDIVVAPYVPEFIDLGFATEIPEGLCALVLPRSGSGSKFGMALSNTNGLIDSDYRDTWKASIFLNGGGREAHFHGTQDRGVLKIRKGQAFAQFVLLPYVYHDLVHVTSIDDLSKTARLGGFSSTDGAAGFSVAGQNILDDVSRNP